MASHDLSNTKTKILGATPGAIPELRGTHMKDFHFAPAFFGGWHKTFQQGEGISNMLCHLMPQKIVAQKIPHEFNMLFFFAAGW